MSDPMTAAAPAAPGPASGPATAGIAPEPGVPASVGVLGGGRMGAGIAHAFLLAGATVTVVEADADSARAARDRVRTHVERSAARGPLPAGDGPAAIEETMRGLTAGADAGAFAGLPLVVEAVPEEPALKARMLDLAARELYGGGSAGAEPHVLASNTSSLSIDELAAALPRPDLFLGLHFFNPVPASGLVEIVVGAATDPGVVLAAQGWVRALGKTPVTVRDSPGFASSRLGVALGLEAIRMLEDGVASAEDIDAAMSLGYKHPVGPLRLTDIVGLDVRLGIAEYLFRRLGPRFEPPRLLREKVAAGELGQKTGRGFYDWPDPSRGES